MPEPALKGTCVMVTGGSMGIGLAAAESSLRAGARVAICARTMSGIEAAVASLKGQGFADVFGVECDVTDRDQLEQALDAVEGRFGPLNALIHAAGVYGPIGPVVDVNPEQWMDAVRVNLFGSFLVIAVGGARLARNGGGRIALFAGGGAASPFPNYSAYACGKVGLVRLTETAAIEMAPLNVELNCIAPGFVVTRLHEQTLEAGLRAGAQFLETTKAHILEGGVPASVGARAAVFLISDDAAGITGKFVAAPYDRFEEWPDHLDSLGRGDLFTLRRIVPRDRGLDWQ